MKRMLINATHSEELRVALVDGVIDEPVEAHGRAAPRHHGHEAASVALVDQVCQRLKVPSRCRDLARLPAIAIPAAFEPGFCARMVERAIL